jgi:hypothetical protein
MDTKSSRRTRETPNLGSLFGNNQSLSKITIESNESSLSHPGHLVISLLAFNRDAHQIHDLHIRKYFDRKCMIFSSELLQPLLILSFLALFDSCCFCCCSHDDNKESISLLLIQIIILWVAH